MAYQPPSVGPAGLSIPTEDDYKNYLISQFQGIYGQTVYLGTDSADYQDIAVRALQASDTTQGIQLLYLSFNPLTATGGALDLLGKLIGVARKAASFSTVQLTVSGTAATVITNGVAQDVNGNYWNLPTSVTIGAGGTISVTAMAQLVGNVNATAGQVSIIATPTAGWTSVTNPASAIAGQPVEPDSQYRARLLISQASPSETLTAGTSARIAALPGVTRSRVYENPYGFTTGFGLVNTSGTAVTLVSGYPFDSTNVGGAININNVAYAISSVTNNTTLVLSSSAGTQSNVQYFIGDGFALGPKNSITCVVEGGTSTAIAQAIYDNRGIGCGTNGTTSVVITDPNNGNLSMTISYDVLTYLQIYVAITVHGLTGFTSATQTAIQSGTVDYLNSLGIGQTVVYSEITGAALTARPDPDQPLFSIRSITVGMLEVATGANITSGANTITVSTAVGIANGQTVVGTGIPNGTTVTGASGTTITMSQNATAAGINVSVWFFATGTSDIPVTYNAAAQSNSQFVVVSTV